MLCEGERPLPFLSADPSNRTQPQKHSARQGSRNATKKRNKYGKVERINTQHDW
jgi:hypothetical protein